MTRTPFLRAYEIPPSRRIAILFLMELEVVLLLPLLLLCCRLVSVVGNMCDILLPKYALQFFGIWGTKSS